MVTGLQAPDEMPLDGPGQHVCLLPQLLRVVLAKVQLAGRRLVEGQDVIGRLELRHGYQSDLRGYEHAWDDRPSTSIGSKRTGLSLATAAIRSWTAWSCDTRALALAGSIFISVLLILSAGWRPRERHKHRGRLMLRTQAVRSAFVAVLTAVFGGKDGHFQQVQTPR